MLNDLQLTVIDYHNPNQGRDLLALLNAYACDPMGGGEPLSQYVRANLLAALQTQPNTFTLIAYNCGEPIAFATVQQGFSTFACKPLLNVHDLAVLTHYRGLGLAGKMLAEIEQIAQERGCCKITLEVLEANQAARAAYARHGFKGYELDPQMGQALFLEKKLPPKSNRNS